MTKPGSAFSVKDPTPAATNLAALWKNVYTDIMERAHDAIRRKTGSAFDVAKVKRPTPAPGTAFSVWPQEKPK